MTYIDHIEKIAAQDAKVLRAKDREYGGSWLKRGGVGAFMMLARKWDRLEAAMERPSFGQIVAGADEGKLIESDRYDIINRAVVDGREEGILDDIGDLRRYLLLVESEVRQRITVRNCMDPADGGVRINVE